MTIRDGVGFVDNPLALRRRGRRGAVASTASPGLDCFLGVPTFGFRFSALARRKAGLVFVVVSNTGRWFNQECSGWP